MKSQHPLICLMGSDLWVSVCSLDFHGKTGQFRAILILPKVRWVSWCVTNPILKLQLKKKCPGVQPGHTTPKVYIPFHYYFQMPNV